MFVQRFSFTVLAFLFFVGMLFGQGLFPMFDKVDRCLDGGGAWEEQGDYCRHEVVSPETYQRVTVKQGQTEDGTILVSFVDEVPVVPQSLKIQNRARTLRAFTFQFSGKGREGRVLYLESVKPRAFYVVTGRFDVSQEPDSPAWNDDTTLYFRAVDISGTDVSYYLNVATLELQIDSGDTPPASRTPAYGAPE